MPPMFINWDSWMALVVKNLPANAGDIRDEDSIPGLGRFPGVGHSNHSSILAWRIPRGQRYLAGYQGVHGVAKSPT